MNNIRKYDNKIGREDDNNIYDLGSDRLVFCLCSTNATTSIRALIQSQVLDIDFKCTHMRPKIA